MLEHGRPKLRKPAWKRNITGENVTLVSESTRTVLSHILYLETD